MDGRSCRCLWVLLGLLGIGLVTGSATASPIRRHRIIVVRNVDSLGSAWAHFLEGGPTRWAAVQSPRFPSGLLLPTTNGQLIDTPFVDYLDWRRSLNPRRFDHYHPFIGPALGNLIPPTNLTTPIPPPSSISSAGEPSVNPAPQIGTPEPGSLAMSLTLIGAGILWRRCMVTRI